MKSTISVNFSADRPVVFGDYIAELTLNISNSYWPPIIDIEYTSDTTTQVSGPLMAILIEICKKMRISVRYIRPTKDELDVYYQMLDNGSVDLLLFPIIPTSEKSITKLLTIPMGFLNMISVMSGVGWQQARTFNFVYCYDPFVWISLAVSYALVATLASLIKNNGNQYLVYYSIITNQSNKLELARHATSYVVLLTIWLFLSAIFFYGFHESLLIQILHEKPHVLINSIEDLAEAAIEGRLIEFYAFKGESCEKFINDRTDVIGQTLRPKMKIINIEEDYKQEWENQLFPKLSTGEYALISDNSFLDYYYISRMPKYQNIYMGTEKLLALPYFMAFSANVPDRIRNDFNMMTRRLIDFGVYEYNMRDSLNINNEAFRLGLIDSRGHKQYRRRRRLRLEHLLGNFYILSVLSFVCVITLIIEYFHFTRTLSHLWCRCYGKRRFERHFELKYENLRIYRQISSYDRIIIIGH